MAELHKEEYQTLRKEVETAMAELNTLESGALLAVSGIFAWLVTHEVDGDIRLGWFIPCALVLFCILRAWAINKHLGWLGNYLMRHEEKFIRPQLLGWEHFLSEKEESSMKPRRGFRGKVTFVFWGALLIATIAGGYRGYTTEPRVQKLEKAGKSSDLESTKDMPSISATRHTLIY